MFLFSLTLPYNMGPQKYGHPERDKKVEYFAPECWHLPMPLLKWVIPRLKMFSVKCVKRSASRN